MLNNYEVIDFREIRRLEPLGKGTFGIVYRAMLQRKTIAFKEFLHNEKHTLEEEITQSFRIPKHPHIVELYGVSFNSSFIYLLMEYADSGTLKEFLFGKRTDNDWPKPEYTTERVIEWMCQCAEGVAFLHSTKPKPLLHRDLKPTNLLLTNRYKTLKLCDFGTVAELKTNMTENKGSLAYMAPEVFNNKTYDEKCDVFSYGIILWEVFACKQYEKTFNSGWAIPQCVQDGVRPVAGDNWPNDITNLMESCWKAIPSERPSMKFVELTIKAIRLSDNKNESKDKIITPRPGVNLSSNTELFDICPEEIYIQGTKVEILESLTSLSKLTKQAYESGLFGITYKTQWNGEIVALKEYKRTGRVPDRGQSFYIAHIEDNHSDYPFLRIWHENSTALKQYIITEYATDGSLYNVLHKDQLLYYSEQQEVTWLLQSVQGLAYLHKEKITQKNKRNFGCLPLFDKAVPEQIRNILTDCLSRYPQKRPSIDYVVERVSEYLSSLK